MRNSFKRLLHTQDAYERALSATFTHGNGHRNVHTAVLTLDDALAQIDVKSKALASRKRHREAYPQDPATTQKRIFSMAKAIAANSNSKKRVKMPTFSIQQREETDA